MNCNLTDSQRETGMVCRSFLCTGCRNFGEVRYISRLQERIDKLEKDIVELIELGTDQVVTEKINKLKGTLTIVHGVIDREIYRHGKCYNNGDCHCCYLRNYLERIEKVLNDTSIL